MQDSKTPSSEIAQSVNVSPVTVRQVTGNLREAGLIRSQAGSGKILLNRPAEEISLKDIYLAVSDGTVFNLNNDICKAFPIANGVVSELDKTYSNVEKVMLEELAKVHVSDLVRKISQGIGELRWQSS